MAKSVLVKSLATMNQYCVFFCLVLYIVHLRVYADENQNIDVDYYFGSGRAALRLRPNSDEPHCSNLVYQHLCYVGCPEHHVCFMKNCVCVDLRVVSYATLQRLDNKWSELEESEQNQPEFFDLSKMSASPLKSGYKSSELEEKRQPDFVDLTKISARQQRSGYKSSELEEKIPPVLPSFVDLTKTSVINTGPYDDYYPKPALRHHIAHFCPNLDEARACIRKCMPLGKPAFCGKDHVCYCGHRYGKIPSDGKIDVKSIYGQFKDLYQKYFGNNHPGLPQSEEKYDSDESHEESKKTKKV